MKTFPIHRSLGLLLLALPTLAQGDGHTGQPPTTGGTYTGPGDTVPGAPRPQAGPPPVSSPPRPGGDLYRGPGDTVPPSGVGFPTDGPEVGGGRGPARLPSSPRRTDTEPPPSPSSPPRIGALFSWQMWWHYERWSHLAEHAETTSGSAGFYLGRGQKPRIEAHPTLSNEQLHDYIAPALSDAAASEDSEDLAAFALHALAKMQWTGEAGERFHARALEALQGSSTLISERAIIALGVSGDVRYLPWLQALLLDRQEGREWIGGQRVDARRRAFAAYALAILGESLEETDRRQIVCALQTVIAPQEESLADGCGFDSRELSRPVDLRAACVYALGRVPLAWPLEQEAEGTLDRAHQIAALERVFLDPRESYLVRALVPGSLALLLDGAPHGIRARTLSHLMQSAHVRSDERHEVVDAALVALGRTGTSGSDPLEVALRELLVERAFKTGGERSLRYRAIMALARASRRPGPGEDSLAGVAQARKAILRSVERARGEALAWNALALGLLEGGAAKRGEVPDPASGRTLRKQLRRTRSADTAGALAIALGLMRDVEAGPQLEALLEESGASATRAYSALALGLIGNSEAAPALRRLLLESVREPEVIENTAIALGMLEDREVGPKLFDILWSSASPRVQASVASALGWIRDPRPVEELVRILSDRRRNSTARAWTSVCLGRICAASDQPWNERFASGVPYELPLWTLIEPVYQSGLLDLP